MGRPIKDPDAGQQRYRKIVEAALGHKLPAGAVVHHVDGNRLNNRHSNLVVCPDESYHNLLHMRQAALDACGHADWQKCYVCKNYDDPVKLLSIRKAGRRVTTFYHAICRNAYRKAAALKKDF